MDFIKRKDMKVNFDKVLYFQASNRAYNYYKLLVERSKFSNDFINYFLYSSSTPDKVYLPQCEVEKSTEVLSSIAERIELLSDSISLKRKNKEWI